MKVVKRITELRTELSQLKKAGRTIGLVPTMGYLHKGHLSLIDIAGEKCDIVVTSIFVNPTQFAPNEDLDKYPRDFALDETLAEKHGSDIIFYPDVDEMYGENYSTYVITEKLSEVLCGASRKTHFRGVTSVVAKLFNIVQPDIAVFGRKDNQQAIIIKRMVADLNFPVEIVTAPIVREKDGLAMSSRNKYLSEEQRKQAPVIHKALLIAKEKVEAGWIKSDEIRSVIQKIIERSSMAQIEYIEIVEDETLRKVEEIKAGTFAAVAVYYGTTRLIDNIYLWKK